MDPITMMTLASMGVSLFGSMKQSQENRRQAREQARLQRLQIAEMERRTEMNISLREQEAGQAQSRAIARIAGAGIAPGGSLTMAHMNNIANEIAREVLITRRESEYAARTGLAEARNMELAAKQQKTADFINILGQAGSMAAQFQSVRPSQGAATPRQRQAAMDSVGSGMTTSLLDLGGN